MVSDKENTYDKIIEVEDELYLTMDKLSRKFPMSIILMALNNTVESVRFEAFSDFLKENARAMQ